MNANFNTSKRKKICFIATVELPLKMFLSDQLRALSKQHEIVVVVNSADPGFLERKGISVRVVTFSLMREIAPVSDAISLVRLTSFLLRERFDAVHTINPKSGLIGMLAAFIARVPVRVHTFTGQVWITRKGLIRTMLKALDWLIAALATHIVADSTSQLKFLREQRVVPEDKGFVPGHGSVGGVDVFRFSYNDQAREKIRRELGIPEDGIVFLFVGRMNPDKGLEELAYAFLEVGKLFSNSHLLIVGPDEKGMQRKVKEICRAFIERVHILEYTDAPERYMSASDVLCLPSYREGFGTVIIEAASVGIPAVGSKIYGLTDAIVEGETGLFHRVGDIKELAEKMSWLALHPGERLAMGKAARLRARNEFSQETLTAAMLRFYDDVLGTHLADV